MSGYIGRQEQSTIVEEYATYVNPGRVRVYQALGVDWVPGKREGVWMWDVEGRHKVLNCRSSGGVFNLGHCPPRVVDAVRAAMDEIDVGDHMLLSEQRAALGRRLCDLTPGDIQYSTFSPGGAEAIDVAIKLARGCTGRVKVISVKFGYHGHTGLALAAGEEVFWGKFGPRAPGFVQVPFDDAQALQQAVDDDTAAVIVETIPATAGILIPSPGYYENVRRICDEAGAVWILDEVQAGLGRTGRMWAIEEWGVVPDILVIGKGLSGGVYPMPVFIRCRRHATDRISMSSSSAIPSFICHPLEARSSDAWRLWQCSIR